MNDFSELENELKKLRPAQPSPILFERVEEALDDCRAGRCRGARPTLAAFERPPYNWLSFGFGLAAAAVLVLFAAISLEHRQERGEEIAQISPAPETRPVSPAAGTETDPHPPIDLFLLARRRSFITRATKDCSLHEAQSNRCAAFAIRRIRRGSGVIRRLAHHFVFLTPARKSSSFRFQANDSTKQNYENKIHRYNRSHRLVADLRICSNTTRAARAASSAPSTGPPGVPGHHEKGPKVPMTYLGVETSQVPDVVSEQLGLAKGLGLVVEYVEPNSPAASAGVQQNDILKMLNDQILIEPSQLRKLLQTFSEGTEVTLTILRKGQEQKITVKLAKKEVPQRHS